MKNQNIFMTFINFIWSLFKKEPEVAIVNHPNLQAQSFEKPVKSSIKGRVGKKRKTKKLMYNASRKHSRGKK